MMLKTWYQTQVWLNLFVVDALEWQLLKAKRVHLLNKRKLVGIKSIIHDISELRKQIAENKEKLERVRLLAAIFGSEPPALMPRPKTQKAIQGANNAPAGKAHDGGETAS